MMSVLFAALLLWSQSTDASAQAQPPVQAEEAAPMEEAAAADATTPVQEPEPAAQQQSVTQTAAATEPAEPSDEEVICRRKLVEGNGFGQRNVIKKVCKTRTEWSQGSRRRD